MPAGLTSWAWRAGRIRGVGGRGPVEGCTSAQVWAAGRDFEHSTSTTRIGRPRSKIRKHLGLELSRNHRRSFDPHATWCPPRLWSVVLPRPSLLILRSASGDKVTYAWELRAAVTAF